MQISNIQRTFQNAAICARKEPFATLGLALNSPSDSLISLMRVQIHIEEVKLENANRHRTMLFWLAL